VLPANARPLKHWKTVSAWVTCGVSECITSTCSTSGFFSPFSRMISAPNIPRATLIVPLGPWSWYGQTPADPGTHSQV
jgi:hypothetical protein